MSTLRDLSSSPSSGRAPVVPRLVVVLAGIAALSGAALLPPPTFPAFLASSWWEAAAHAVAWGILAGLMRLALPRGRRPPWVRSLGIFLLAMIVGVAVEVLQATTAGRDAQARDLVADAVGVVAALLATPLLAWLSGGQIRDERGVWAPTSMAPTGIVAAVTAGGVAVGLAYLRHTGGGVLGDAAPPGWMLERPVAAAFAAGVLVLLVGRTLVFFARTEGAVRSRKQDQYGQPSQATAVDGKLAARLPADYRNSS